MVWAVINKDVNNAISEFADSTSDRVCAIVGAAMVEEALLRTLESRLRQSGVKDMFFSPNRATGAFSAKIQLAYLLGACDEAAFKSMSAIADIRNLFAHRLSIKTFADPDPKLQEHLGRLSLHTAYSEYPHPLFDGSSGVPVEPITTERERFTVNAEMILVLMMRDGRMHLPNSNQFQPLPAAPVLVPRPGR